MEPEPAGLACGMLVNGPLIAPSITFGTLSSDGLEKMTEPELEVAAADCRRSFRRRDSRRLFLWLMYIAGLLFSLQIVDILYGGSQRSLPEKQAAFIVLAFAFDGTLYVVASGWMRRHAAAAARHRKGWCDVLVELDSRHARTPMQGRPRTWAEFRLRWHRFFHE